MGSLDFVQTVNFLLLFYVSFLQHSSIPISPVYQKSIQEMGTTSNANLKVLSDEENPHQVSNQSCWLISKQYPVTLLQG